MDSGATSTILGGPGWDSLKELGIKIKPVSTFCTVANGERCESIGVVSVPIRVRDRIKIFEILVIPSLKDAVILGTDFWKIMGIVPDLRSGEWVFSNLPPAKVNAIESRSNLTEIQENKLTELINEECKGFSADTLGRTHLVEHVIHTDAEPIKQRCRPISPALQKHIEKELDVMLQMDVIEKSNSPWSSPILMVPKKDGSLRFCVDFRRLNSVTRRDAYPMPNVTTILDRLRDARYLSSLDIAKAYWQVPVAENSKQYTAFAVLGRGLFQFKRLPFGLHNGPATWMRLIDSVLGPELEPYVFVYLDDVIIVTDTFEKHLEILQEVLKRLREAGLIINREKCKFCRSELEYLGYVINQEGLQVHPNRIKAIVDIPTPKSVKEVRRMIGMVGWYRRFIKDMATMVEPLTHLLKKNAKFKWTPQCEQAWNEVKNCLISSPILTCPNFEKEFFVQTDSSDYGIGAVLTQQYEEGEKVISYLSRSLSRQERRYSTTERELLALMWSIERLKPYLEGTRFTAITDHYSLKWLHSLENPSGRLARWTMRLSQFDFRIIHRKGKDHVVPDTLSRAVPVSDDIEALKNEYVEEDIMPRLRGPSEIVIQAIKKKSLEDDVQVTPSDEGIRDNWFLNLTQKIKKTPLKYPAYRLDGKRLFKYVQHPYSNLVGEAAQWREVVPKERRRELIHTCHDRPTSGHLGVYKTYHRLAQDYTWPKMKCDVTKYISRCVVCLKAKPEQKLPPGRMGGHSNVSRPWEVISTDIIGPLPRSTKNYNFILVVLDIFSKYVRCFPLRKATASNIVKHLENDIFLIYGVPRSIISDNGVQYRSREYKKLLESYKVKPSYVALYHPQANPCERANRVIKTILISYVSENHREWDKMLPKVECAIRTAKHEVTELTPYFVNHGREMCLDGGADFTEIAPGGPNHDLQVNRDDTEIKQRTKEFGKLYKDVQSRLHKAYVTSKRRYDLRHRSVEFYPHQLVWRRNFVLSDATKHFAAKLADKFIGPFMIHKRVAHDVYELADLKGKVLKGAWPVRHLKASPDNIDDETVEEN